MHFSTIYLLKDEELDDLSLSDIEEDFCERFCYCCGETRPRYQYWCDWFQIGGRWNEMFKAVRGFEAQRSLFTVGEPKLENHFAVVEIKDLQEPIDKENVYAIATRSRIYTHNDYWGGTESNVNESKFNELLDKINNKKIKGVIAWIDCHD